MNFEQSEEEKKDYLKLANEKGINLPEFLILIEKTIKQIEIITPALENLKSKISDIQPDRIIFLSKGADLFFNPFKKYFEENGIHQEIDRYNDDDLKGLYLNQALDIEFVKKSFPKLSDQKIIFVDETFSAGKGALAIYEMAHIVNAKNIYYFALSQDSNKKSIEENLEMADSKIDPSKFKNDLSTIEDNPNFILNNCFIDENLFSSDIGKKIKYDFRDDAGNTITLKRDLSNYGVDKEKNSKIPNAFSYSNKDELEREKERLRQSFLTEELMEEIIYDAIARE
ncbi:MAG: hypothetical protein WCX74_02655 [Candidatus Paceibacterota bacterium]